MRRLIGLLFTLGCVGVAPVAPPHAAALENLEGQFLSLGGSNHAPSGDAVFDAQAAELHHALGELSTIAQKSNMARPTFLSGFGLVLLVVFAIGGSLIFRRLLPVIAGYLADRSNLCTVSPDAAAGPPEAIRREDKAISEFAAAFRTGPSAMSGPSQTSVAAAPECDPLKAFFAKAPRLLGKLHKLLPTIGRTPEPTVRRALLGDLSRELQDLKREAGLPELLPVWQMTAAVEGLVKQLADKAGNVTPSTLRTVAGGVDALKHLCVPGLKPDLLTSPPIRLLAVDDDPISRTAVSLALKKAFSPPDSAGDGESALALATKQTYDVIFLDVEMPGMDGFELCTRVHDTVSNRATPVVFVTCHSDFASRAQATLRGGTDLLAKPFLAFEITVKALTLALQGRLPARAQTASTRQSLTDSTLLSPAPRSTDPAQIAASRGRLNQRIYGSPCAAASP